MNKPLPPARLGVNIDHVATLRNARGGTHPDPVDAARTAIEAGADGITAHLREDRRHITDSDLERLAALCEETGVPLNMELAATDEMRDIAVRLKPYAACLVPERREERTTEGGLDVAGQHNRLVPIIADLAEAGCRVSLFIEAVPAQIDAAASTRAEVVEFHTGAYAHALDDGDTDKADSILAQLRDGGTRAHAAGLEVHYGHGLTFENVAPVAAIPEARELNIGHFIIGEAVFLGLDPAIRKMASLIADARANDPEDATP
ncbi:MAG: pyridoxine 5'-phosphate synthase [Litorimonas sp.]